MDFRMARASNEASTPSLPVPGAPQPRGRRRWAAAELAEIVAALSRLRTVDIAGRLGVNPKALRSALRRNGISLRLLREGSAPEPRTGTGLLLRRSVHSPSARFGAEALAQLDEGRCRWPIGDPAEEGFAFCGSRVHGRWPYCPTHVAQAFHHDAEPSNC